MYCGMNTYKILIHKSKMLLELKDPILLQCLIAKVSSYKVKLTLEDVEKMPFVNFLILTKVKQILSN